jgi:hypothetical protein
MLFLAAYLNNNISIQFVNWGIKGSLLRAFTNRFFFHPNTLHELLSIKRWIKKQAPNHAQWVLEQNKRKWLIELATQTKFDVLHRKEIFMKPINIFLMPKH